jgi:predicted transcriptional regulator
MTIHPTPELEAKLTDIARRTGRDVNALAQEALEQYVEAENRRAELRAELDEGEASLAHGQGREITPESMRELAEAVKQRGRARLAQGQDTRR